MLVPALRAQVVEILEKAAKTPTPGGAATEAASKEEKPGKGKKGPPRGVTPGDFRGPALPREDTSLHSRFERADELFGKSEWGKGLDILDGILSGRELSEQKGSPSSAKPPTPPGGVPAPLVRVARFVRGGMRIVQRAMAPAPAETKEDQAGTVKKGEQGDPHKLVYSDDGIHYVPLIGRVHARLLDVPEEGLEVYRRTYEPPAKKRLEEALELPFSESLSHLEALFLQYPLTASGLSGLKALGDRALDLGKPKRAVRAFRQLLKVLQRHDTGSEDDSPVIDRTLLATKLAFAQLVAGRTRDARRTLDRIRKDPDEVITLGGEPVRVGDLLTHPVFRQLRDSGTQKPPPFTVWSGPKGSPRRSSIDLPLRRQPPLGSRAKWIFRFNARQTIPRDDPRPSFSTRTALREGNPRAAFPSIQVASREGLVFVRSGHDLVALDTASGKIRWLAKPGTLQMQNTNRYSYYSSPAWNDYEMLGGNSISLADDLVMILDRQSPTGYDKKRKLVYLPNRLFAYHAASGKLRWRLGGPEEPTTKLRSITFTAPPCPAGDDLLVVPATENDAAYILGLHRKGRLLWMTRLYGYNMGYLQRYRNSVSQGASLATDGQVAVAAPGHGVVSAVSVDDGSIRWITRYRVDNEASTSRSSSSETTWIPSHPVIAGQYVVIAAYDSDHLTVLDLASGKSVWEKPFADGGVYQLLGADTERVYIGGRLVEAFDLESGERIFQSEPFRYSAGRGFTTLGDEPRIFLPLEDGIAVLNGLTGKAIQRLGWKDERMERLRPGNLALLASSAPDAPTGIVASSSWGVARIQPIDTTWQRLGERNRGEVFARARLLEAEGRYAESLDVLERILAVARTEATIQLCTKMLVETARKAALQLREPEHLDRILANEGLETDTTARTRLRLDLAWLLETRDPLRAAQIYLQLLKPVTSDDRVVGTSVTLETPDSVQAALGQHLKDSLGRLVRSGKIDVSIVEDTSLRRVLDKIPTDTAEARQLLRRILNEKPYVPEVAETLARLIEIELRRGDPAAARVCCERLLAEFPSLREHDELRKLESRLDRTRSTTEAPPERRPRLPPSSEEFAWAEAFWKGNGEGFLVETHDRSDVLPALLAMRGGKLRIFDATGKAASQVTLPDFPDVEKSKAALKSHIEEPAWLLPRGPEAVLLTAAGVYSIRWKPPKATAPPNATAPTGPEGPQTEAPRSNAPKEPSEESPSDAAKTAEAKPPAKDGSPKPPMPPPPVAAIGWRHTFQHRIQQVDTFRQQFGRGLNIFSRATGNIFPEFVVPSLRTDADDGGDKTIIIVRTDGRLTGLDLRTGKAFFRGGQENSTLGEPVMSGTRRLVLTTASPPGVAVYDVDALRAGSAAEPGFSLQLAGKSTGSVHGVHLVAGEAVVFDTWQSVEVHDVLTKRLRWKKFFSHTYAPSVVRVTATEVWFTTPDGELQSRSLLGGRLNWTRPAPRNASVIAVFDAASAADDPKTPDAPRALWVVLAAEGRSPGVHRSSRPFTRSGESLHFLKMTETGEVLVEKKLGKRGVTFDALLSSTRDGALIVYNEGLDEGKWATRVASFDLVTGEVKVLLERPIAGKGTGMPPRFALVSYGEDEVPGIALGNSEGFGLFLYRPKELPPEKADDGEAKDEKNDKGEDTIPQEKTKSKDTAP